jgi:penicillin-binding protein 1C
VNAAVKTGTTTDWHDNWTIGYAPEFTVGVWIGNASRLPMYEISGVTGAGPIWHTMITRLCEEVGCSQYPEVLDQVVRSVAKKNSLTQSEIRYWIVSPKQGIKYEQLPKVDEMIVLELNTEEKINKVEWKIDGQEVKCSRQTLKNCWWKPNVGHHQLNVRVTNISGTEYEVDPVRFEVK